MRLPLGAVGRVLASDLITWHDRLSVRRRQPARASLRVSFLGFSVYNLLQNWGFGLGDAIGLVAALIFYGRFYLQWYTSERLKRSVVPIGFWYMSSAGSLLLFATRVRAVGGGHAFALLQHADLCAEPDSRGARGAEPPPIGDGHGLALGAIVVAVDCWSSRGLTCCTARARVRRWTRGGPGSGSGWG